MRVLGMISGTSFDGIDVAAADLAWDDDTIVLRPLGAWSHPYPDDVRAALVAAMPPNATTAAAVCELDTRIGQVFADAAEHAAAELAGGEADLIASHGQTLFHWVDGQDALGTLQIGQAAWIAGRTGLPVVADVRARDLAAGGQGAPLASLLDVLLLGHDAPEPRAALNLGGIANLTIVGGGRAPIAFDTGPANALLDVAVERLTGGAQTFDRDGRLAAQGEVDPELLDRLLAEPYYALEPPKTTGKELFHVDHLLDALDGRTVDVDVLATLVSLSAETVAVWCRRHGVEEVVAAGGGVANPTLMAELGRRLGDGVALRRMDELGLPADAKEAYLLALIGFLTVHDLPATVASCTGARESSILGAVLPGRDGLPRPEVAVTTSPARLRVAPT